MKRNYFRIFLVVLVSLCSMGLVSAQSQSESITVKEGNVSFGTDFYVLFRTTDPDISIRNLPECRYFAPTWKVESEKSDGRSLKTNISSGGDGIDDNMSNSLVDRTYDYFNSAQIIKFECVGQYQEGKVIHFVYPEQNIGKLEVKAYQVSDTEWKMTYDFQASQQGYYSVVYMGAPARESEDIDFIFQPMVWQQRRFPLKSYMTLAYCCSVPAAFLNSKGTSWGVVVSPEEFPFNPLPQRGNDRFGILSKDDQGTFRPMVASPIMGGHNSLMKRGERFDFNFYLYSSHEEPTHVYERIARDIYHFKDYRKNDICNLNETIDNMGDYILTEYSCFIDSLKGCSYSTDVPGSVNNSNSLNPISIALLSDDMEMMSRRAIPITEYMMSRNRPLFCLDTTQKTQNPTRKMGGPCAHLNEMAGLHYFSNSKDSYYLDHVEKGKFRKVGELWGYQLDLYRATGDKKYLEKAIEGADEYIYKTLPAESTSLLKKGFWNAYSPDFKYLLELYEETQEERFLEAAYQGARLYAMYIWMCPMIPDQQVLINKGGVAPHYWYLRDKGFPQMKADEKYIDAWRLSEIGLLPESSFTSIGHRAVFMAHHAPYMLRLAHYKNDAFLYDIARSAIVGRYRNFPGYHINTTRTDIYEQKDYPLHKWQELSVNSFHYNHPLPMLSLLYDYLITDFWNKSGEKIAFPSFHSQSHAYLQEKVYGNEPGVFYGYDQVTLWMPKRILSDVDVELNYLMGRDGKNLFISFSNQCTEKRTCSVNFDSKRIHIDPTRSYQVEVFDAAGNKTMTTLEKGRLSVEVPAQGIQSYVIKDVEVMVELQDKFFNKTNHWNKKVATTGRYEGSHAYMIDFGKDLKEVYTYIESDDRKVSKVNFEVVAGEETSEYTDCYYPFEFTAPVSEKATGATIRLTITYKNGSIKSETLRLKK